MSPQRQPRRAAQAVLVDPQLPGGAGERFHGYGVMGMPFASGHYLTVRHFPVTSIGPGYTAVWHRDPQGRWQIYTTSEPELSCPRFFSAATSFPARTVEIEETWVDEHTLRVTVPDAVNWQVRIGTRPATRLMSAVGSALPDSAWANDLLLTMMSWVAGPVLSVGKVRLAGTAPNLQHFQFAPKRVWSIEAASATVNGQDAGEPGRLTRQTGLGDFWLPQLGIFATGTARFDSYDPDRHLAATQLVA